MPNVFESSAKFEEVAKDKYALDAHYRRYKRGEKYTLAKTCFLHVEKLASEGVQWAKDIRNGTF
jgi:hypothetical protein